QSMTTKAADKIIMARGARRVNDGPLATMDTVLRVGQSLYLYCTAGPARWTLVDSRTPKAEMQAWLGSPKRRWSPRSGQSINFGLDLARVPACATSKGRMES